MFESANSFFNRQNWLRFVYTHFKLCDQFLDKSSFDFSYIIHAMQNCAISAKSTIILKTSQEYGHMT